MSDNTEEQILKRICCRDEYTFSVFHGAFCPQVETADKHDRPITLHAHPSTTKLLSNHHVHKLW